MSGEAKRRGLFSQRSSSRRMLKENFAKEVLLVSNGGILVLVCQHLLEGLPHAEDMEPQDMLMFFFRLNMDVPHPHIDVDPVDVWMPLRHLIFSCRGFCKVAAHSTPGSSRLAGLVSYRIKEGGVSKVVHEDTLGDNTIRELWERMARGASKYAVRTRWNGPPKPGAPKYQVQIFDIPNSRAAIRTIGRNTTLKLYPGTGHAATFEETSRIYDEVKSRPFVSAGTPDRNQVIRENIRDYVGVTSCEHDFEMKAHDLGDILEAMQLLHGFMLSLIARDIDERRYDELVKHTIVRCQRKLNARAEFLVYSLAKYPEDLDRVVERLEDTSMLWVVDFVAPKMNRDHRILGDTNLVAKNGIRRLPQPDSPHEDACYLNTIRAFTGALNKHNRVDHRLYDEDRMCYTGVHVLAREKSRLNVMFERYADRVNCMIMRMYNQRVAAFAAGKAFEFDPACCRAVWRELCKGRRST